MTSLESIRIAVLVDDMRVTVWQSKALKSLGPITPLSIYSCTNTHNKKNIRRHAAYYALALYCVRNSQARLVPVEIPGVGIGSVTHFAAGVRGTWQSLPSNILAKLHVERPDVILKFGMGLLSVPEGFDIPILSYHHGDPTGFRGRPAGFYEMASGTPVMGQIVQRLTNRLDAGSVLAFAETRVHPDSYRKTLVEAFRHSPYILRQAIDNALSKRTIDMPPTGRNYRLPGHLQVATLTARMACHAARRILYGALVEKRWRVCIAQAPNPTKIIGSAGPLPAGKVLPIDERHSLVADPFFWNDETIVAEALDAHTGLGELVMLDEGGARRVSPPGGHFSYPATVEEAGETFIVPETASWARPTVYRPSMDGLKAVQPLDVDDDIRLLDPTFLRHDGILYLFANRAELGANMLFLWWADSLFGRFQAHPQSPVAISPCGARMAGNFVRTPKRLVRLGQDGARAYGDGVFTFEVDLLTKDDYRERRIGRIALTDAKGPHTINIGSDRIVYDFYHDAMSPLAGIRRLRARLQRAPSHRSAAAQTGTHSII